MRCREVYQQEIIFSSIQTEQGQRKSPQNTQELSEKVEDILTEALDDIEDKQDMDLFYLIEEVFSETDSYQGTENTTPNAEILKTCNVDNTVPSDEDNGNASFYNDNNEQFHQDYPPTPRREIFSPWFIDPLLSSDIPSLATRDNINIIHSNKKSNQTKSSQLR